MIRRHRAIFFALTLTAAAALVLALAGPAGAATSLGTGGRATAAQPPNPLDEYSLQTRTGFWAAVGVLPGNGYQAGWDFDLRILRRRAVVGGSLQGAGVADFVVVNSHPGCPSGRAYTAQVNRSASGQPATGTAYDVQVSQGRVLQVGTTTSVDVFNNVFIAYDVLLTAGRKYDIFVTQTSSVFPNGSYNGFFGLYSPDTTACVKDGPKGNAWHLSGVVDFPRMHNTFTPTVTGWYGFVAYPTVEFGAGIEWATYDVEIL